MSSRRSVEAKRAIAPLVGVLALLAIAVVLAAVVAVGVGSIDTAAPPPTATFDLAVDADEGSIEIDHVAGDPIDVDALSVAVTVEGEALAHQPPVPFFAATGFVSGPEGPFNEAADSEWSAGERAGFRVAATNGPSIDRGDEVVVTLETEAGTVARLRTTAR